MPLQNNLKIPQSIKELTPQLCAFLNDTRNSLSGSNRRLFMAKVVKLLGPGGKRKAEACLGWNRCTINKGIKELDSGIVCVDAFSSRGRKGFDFYFPNLRKDIHDIVNPESQADPTFRTTNLYSPLTASEVRRRLISEKGYDDATLPKRQTIANILNQLGYSLKKVQKVKPKKK